MGESSPYRNESWLREKYVGERLSSPEIAGKCGVTTRTICNWLEKFGIERRDQSEAQDLAQKRLKRCTIAFSENYTLAVGNADEGEFVRIHRLCAVAWYGFEAVVDKHVHHRDGCKEHNADGNVEPITHSEHSRLHDRAREKGEDGRYR